MIGLRPGIGLIDGGSVDVDSWDDALYAPGYVITSQAGFASELRIRRSA